MLVVTVRISWHIASIAAVVSPVLFVLARNSSRKVRKRYDEVSELDSSAMLVLHEALNCLRAVKAFGQEAYQDERFRRKSRQRMTEQVRLASIQAGFHVLIGLCVALAAAVAMVMGVTEVRQQMMTVGEFLLVMAYMAQLYEPLRTVSTKIPELQSTMASLHRAFALLEETPEMEETLRPASRCMSAAKSSSATSPSSTGRAGARIAGHLVPCSAWHARGSGGTERIGQKHPGESADPFLRSHRWGHPDRQHRSAGVQPGRLRQQFSIVLQEPMLFSTTVAGNIAYADPRASRAKWCALPS